MQTGIAVHDTDQKERNAMNSTPNHGSSRKEKQMSAITRRTTQPRKNLSAMKHLTITLIGLLALGLAVPAAFGGEPPAATPAALGLEIDGEGRCTGLRVGGTILPWVPSVPTLDRKTASALQRDGDREIIHRVLPDAHGLRWTQTVKNLSAGPMGVGPAFNAKGGVGNPWTAPGLPLRVFMFPKEDVGVSLTERGRNTQTGVSAGLAMVVGTSDRVLEAGLTSGGRMLVQGLLPRSLALWPTRPRP